MSSRKYLNITLYTIQFVDKILIYIYIRCRYRVDVLSTVALSVDMEQLHSVWRYTTKIWWPIGGNDTKEFVRIYSSPFHRLRTYYALPYVCTTKVCTIIVFRTLSGNHRAAGLKHTALNSLSQLFRTVVTAKGRNRFPSCASIFESRRANVFIVSFKNQKSLRTAGRHSSTLCANRVQYMPRTTQTPVEKGLFEIRPSVCRRNRFISQYAFHVYVLNYIFYEQMNSYIIIIFFQPTTRCSTRHWILLLSK